MSEKYNGYTNYETWAVALWLDNDQGSQEMVEEMTKQAKRPYDLADQLKDLHEEYNPLKDANASVYTDLLSHIIATVNWDELANNYFEEYHTDEDDDDNENSRCEQCRDNRDCTQYQRAQATNTVITDCEQYEEEE